MAQPDLPLFSWQPEQQVIVFPVVKRVGRIRDVAAKMLNKPSENAVAHYRKQVTDSLILSLERVGVPQHTRDEHLSAFWEAVHIEILRLRYSGFGRGGVA